MTVVDKRVVVVTGASSGIGRQVAYDLARLDYAVVLNGYHSPARLESVSGRISLEGGCAYTVVADVGDPGQCRSLVAQAHGRYGRLDALVACAGIPMHDEPQEQDFTAYAAPKLYGLSALIESALEAGVCSVVAVSSVPFGNPLSGAVQAGVRELVRQYAGRYACKGVRVNSVSPGWTLTRMTMDNFSTEERALAAGSAPLIGRLLEPAEVSSVITFLLGHPGITGQDIVVDGGYSFGARSAQT
ncbi:MAG: SDR family oxidoreductase [Nanoarchaeota archaeon]